MLNFLMIVPSFGISWWGGQFWFVVIVRGVVVGVEKNERKKETNKENKKSELQGYYCSSPSLSLRHVVVGRGRGCG